MDEGSVALIRVLLLVAALLVVIPGWIVSMIARSKGFQALPWFIFGALLFVPALVVVLIKPPTPERTKERWVEAGGRLCMDCREPVNPGATRCHHCGAPVDVTHEKSVSASNEPRVEPTALAEVEDAFTFFRFELEPYLPRGAARKIRGSAQSGLMAPAAMAAWTHSPDQIRLYRAAVRAAMKDAAMDSGWATVDSVKMPCSWSQYYEVLRDLDEEAPAILALIGDRSPSSPFASSSATPHSSTSSQPSTASAEYLVANWDTTQRSALANELQRRQIPYSIHRGRLIIDATHTHAVDEIVDRLEEPL